jgi:hypothetical protein
MTVVQPKVDLALATGGLQQAFQLAAPGTLDELIGVFLAVTVGRFIVMRMHVDKKPGGYECRHTVFGWCVATSWAVVQDSPTGEGPVYLITFPGRLMRYLWCDEMRVLPGNGLVGRILAIPTGWRRPLKYFAYKRES